MLFPASPGRNGCRAIGVSPTVIRTARRVANRSLVTTLSTPDVAALVDCYRAGTTVYELATRFMRCRGLDPDQVDQAVRLYAQGRSVAGIDARLGVDGGTVWSTLRARGVPTRKPEGRDR
jgi:hypothetical protein